MARACNLHALKKKLFHVQDVYTAEVAASRGKLYEFSERMLARL
jgi:hypothetical protein